MDTHLRGFQSILYTEMPGEHLPRVFGKTECVQYQVVMLKYELWLFLVVKY